MKAETIFMMTMAMIDEMTDTGQLDETTQQQQNIKQKHHLFLLCYKMK